MLDIELKETNWSYDPDATNKLSFQLTMQTPCKIRLSSTKLFWRIRHLTVTTTKMTDAVAWV